MEALVDSGYDAVGVDPEAPAGRRFVRARFETLAPSNSLLRGIEAVVAGRVLHHVHPLDGGLDRLAEIAPLLVVDEFAWDLVDASAQAWYEARHASLSVSGLEPPGPASLASWRERHRTLHPYRPLLEGLRARWRETALEWLPFLHRWLGDDPSEALEREQVEAGAFPAIGWRWAGTRRDDRETG